VTRPATGRGAPRDAANRLWRVETPAGPVLQKMYGEKGGALRSAWRGWMSRVVRGATSSRAEARRRTERETLALWRGAGIDAPEDLTDRHPALGGERVAILEWIEGTPLPRALAALGADRAARDALLRRAGAGWGWRHAVASEKRDARFVQFHGGLQHLLVAGDRIVAIDVEQAYLAGGAVLPRLAREVAACVRSLAKGADPAALRADLAALAAGHPDRALLRAVVAEALRGGGLLRLLDPKRGRREPALRILEEVLAAGA
jgi:hypothetical protein